MARKSPRHWRALRNVLTPQVNTNLLHGACYSWFTCCSVIPCPAKPPIRYYFPKCSTSLQNIIILISPQHLLCAVFYLSYIHSIHFYARYAGNQSGAWDRDREFSPNLEKNFFEPLFLFSTCYLIRFSQNVLVRSRESQ